MSTHRIRYIVLSVAPTLLLLLGLILFSKQMQLNAAPLVNSSSNYVQEANITTVSWISQTIDVMGGMYGDPTAIAIDSNNYPHIGYLNADNADLMYAYWNGSSWITKTISPDENPNSDIDLVLDSNGYPHLSYYAGYDLKYAYWSGSDWITNTVDAFGNAGYYNALALDSNDNPYIAYTDGKDELAYARWNGGAWITETVDTIPGSSHNTGPGGKVVLEMDSQDYPHIGYRYDDQPYLIYTHWDGAQWVIETAKTGYIHSNLSFALDGQDMPHFSYYDFFGDNLEYVHWTGTEWVSETVDSFEDVGSHSSIVIDNLDRPHISYYSYSQSSLKYANWNGTSWITTTIDTGGDVGLQTSLAIDSNGNPHISYYDATNGMLKYAAQTAVSFNNFVFLPMIVK